MIGGADVCEGDGFSLEVTAVPSNLQRIRDALCSWLERLRLSDQLISDVVLAVNEASTNCVEHAYRDAAAVGSVRVEAHRHRGGLRVSVSDTGCWKTPTPALRHRGRGLTLVHAVSDTVVMHDPAGGTRLTMHFAAVG